MKHSQNAHVLANAAKFFSLWTTCKGEAIGGKCAQLGKPAEVLIKMLTIDLPQKKPIPFSR